MVTKGEKNNSNVILEESEMIKIDLVNFFHGKNECAVDVLWHCYCYFHVIHVVLVIILVGNKYLGVELWKA